MLQIRDSQTVAYVSITYVSYILKNPTYQIQKAFYS